ncbi:hypothetical protein, partial [Chryseobacterium sp. SIMBA_028]
GDTIKTQKEKKCFFNDFNRGKKIIDTSADQLEKKRVWHKKEINLSAPVEDLLLYEDQARLTKLLFDAVDEAAVKKEKFHYFEPEKWDLEMI